MHVGSSAATRQELTESRRPGTNPVLVSSEEAGSATL